jgi:3',5'-cyclic AMP phosphodiesterase CpdA
VRDPAYYPRLCSFEPAGIDVLILNSNRRPSGIPLTNAIGLVGTDQLSAASQLLVCRRSQSTLVIVLHHHVIPPSFGFDVVFLRCLDAEAVLRFAKVHAAAAIIHGHTHMPLSTGTLLATLVKTSL